MKDPQGFGVVVMKDEIVIRVNEKPKYPRSPFAITGIYMYDHSIFEAVNRNTPSAGCELVISG